VPPPPATRTLLASFAGVEGAGAAVSAVIASGILPAAVEMMDAPILAALGDAYGLRFPPGAEAVLLLEVDGLDAGLDGEADRIEACCRAAGAFEVSRAADAAERALLWRARKRAFGALGRLSRNYCTQDGVVPRSRLPEILGRIRAVGKRLDLRIANVFHAGDGNLHPVLLYDARKPGESERVMRASEEILLACLELGGSLTGEHGIGAEKIGLMERAFGPVALGAMGHLRRAFDPRGRSNPNKLLPSGGACADSVGLSGPRRPGRQAPV